jgi:hypothetical protein
MTPASGTAKPLGTAPVTVVPKAYDLVLWLIPRVNEFPRAQRFVLGERIESTALDLLDVLVEAQYRRDTVELLGRANLTLVRLRHLLRLANDLHLLGARRFEFVSERVEELGRMIGGWSRQQRGRAPANAPATRAIEGPHENIPQPV